VRLKHSGVITPYFNNEEDFNESFPHVANLKTSLVALPISLTGLFAAL